MGGYAVKFKGIKQWRKIINTVTDRGYGIGGCMDDELQVLKGRYKGGWVYVNTDTRIGFTFWHKSVVKHVQKCKLKEVPHAPVRVATPSQSCTCGAKT